MENKYKNLCIKINSHAEKLAALYFLASKVGNCKIDNSSIDFALNPNGSFEGNYVHTYDGFVTADKSHCDKIVVPFSDLKNFDNYLAPKFVEVVLNKEHTAKVYKDKIVVGCQTFPISIIDDLVAAKAKINQ